RSRGWSDCPALRGRSGTARASRSRASTRTRRSGRCSPSTPRRATSRSPAPASRRRSSSSRRRAAGHEPVGRSRKQGRRIHQERGLLAAAASPAPGGGMNRAYLKYELLRTVRNRRFFFFSLAFPLVLYFLIAGPNRNESDIGGSGLSAPLYFMVSLAAFG